MGAFAKFMASNRSRWGADRNETQDEKQDRESGVRKKGDSSFDRVAWSFDGDRLGCGAAEMEWWQREGSEAGNNKERMG